ncbi:MAG: hypothetical protein V3W20_03635 [Candidatus Neomarinimicrobiota bacterium]
MKFVVATKRYETDLRSLMRSIHIPGRIALSYQREPNYFYGADIQGKKNLTIVGIIKNKLVGLGCISFKPMYINGSNKRFGYLSGLRSIPEVRGGRNLLAAYKYFHNIHVDNNVPAYITTIIDENEYAKSVLTSSRFGLPKYSDWGRYITYAINLNKRSRQIQNQDDVLIMRGTDFELDEIVSFLNRNGSKRQFFPVYSKWDFISNYTRDFSQSNFYVAVKGHKIIGILGVWDQSRFKQNRIIKYHGGLGKFRKIINVVLSLSGYHTLPSPGEELKLLYTAFVCIYDDKPDILNTLLRTIYNDYKNSKSHFLCIGLHEKDPLNIALKQFSTFRYYSRLYVVNWEDGNQFCKKLDKSRVPYLELATL